ncbi:MAG TPA: NAD(P)-dependent oxidoreductase [Acidimicrobiales bacterium]|nr:NAD(P)-dependent oxidoreductase [Acidimicrobiales bacterium]
MAAVGRTKVVVALPLTRALLDQMADYDLAMVPTGGSDETVLAAALADADGVLVSSNVPVGRGVIVGAPGLRVISTMSVGVDHIDLDAAREHGVTVTITPVLSDAVADLTIALMTMLSRRIPDGMRAVADGGWKVPLGGDLAAKTLLLVGFGRIGQAVATRALAAGMRVRYVDSRVGLPAMAGVTGGGTLDDELGDADFVSLHVDLNARTRNLMSRRQFTSMKRTAFFVNTSRGGVVDQAALTWALTEGAISGAGLDVLQDEPPPPDEPLLKAPNVIIVPHIGSATEETRNAMAQCAVDNLRKVLGGQKTPFEVTAS